MTYEQFTYWLRGYLASQTDSQMKIDIERALDQIGEPKQPPLNVPLKRTPWTPDLNPYWYELSTTTCSGQKKEVLND